jgi:hypothetical protein
MRAKMRLIEKSEITPEYGGGVRLRYVGVNRGDKDGPSDPGNPYSAEDSLFGRFTPSADLSMVVKNPNVTDALEQGQSFYVDFTPAE